MRACQLTGQERPTLRSTELPDPAPRSGEVLVALEAASLNYRDLLVAKSEAGLIPMSDGAGTIAALGPDADGFAVGERVMIGFMPGWVEGEFSRAKQATALGGGGVNGVLAGAIAVAASGIVRIPDAMSFEQAATLPCAGVTAWSALFERRPVQPGETVLLLGTGGVSIFALQLAKAAGARVIITSGSDEKLVRAARLGADHVINYQARPDWASEVVRLTDGLGADLAVDVAGPATLNETLRRRGTADGSR